MGSSDSSGPAKPGEGEPAYWHVQYELRDSLARLAADFAKSEESQAAMAADLKTVKQVVGVMPPTPSMAPQARTFQLRQMVIAAVGVATGVAFDRVVALAAQLTQLALERLGN